MSGLVSDPKRLRLPCWLLERPVVHAVLRPLQASWAKFQRAKRLKQGSPESKLRHGCSVDVTAAPVARLPIVVTGTSTSFPPMLTCAIFIISWRTIGGLRPEDFFFTLTMLADRLRCEGG